MKSVRWMRLGLTVTILAVGMAAYADLPSSFDLRNVGGVNYVSPVKNQTGGTCWTHGTMSSMESNLMVTGTWAANGELGAPDLAEYHLDWWNGFNQNNNDDLVPPTGSGLVVHEGGDYRVSSAYLTRGEGAVRDVDGQSYSPAPARSNPNWHYYYARHIEWYVAGADLSNMNVIKQKVMEYGAVATCMDYDEQFMQGTIHYQPKSSTALPNHSIAIVGWDNAKVTQAPQPGAWLCKNSWGASWGEAGFFWISYYDKWCGQEPQMGAVSFQDVEPMRYEHVYYHDYHGWRDTLAGVTRAFNAFVGTGDEKLEAVSFFTAADNVAYVVRIYDRFEGGQLLDQRATVSGTFDYTGFHTVDLTTPIGLAPGDDFYIEVELSAGGQAYDRSSDIPVLLGAKARTWVESTALPGESYYDNGSGWVDLTTYNSSANFCIKGLATTYTALEFQFPMDRPHIVGPGVSIPLTVAIANVVEEYVPGSGEIHYRYDGGDYQTLPLTPAGGDLYTVTLPPAGCDDRIEYYFTAAGNLGHTTFSPIAAPSEVYSISIGTLSTWLTDDFNQDLGWTVENVSLTGGAWQRGVPAGDGTRGDPTVDFDGSGACFLTGNTLGDSDVDGGPTRLISPRLDLSDGGYFLVGYARWFHNNYVPDDDGLQVEVSNDNGATWKLVEYVRHEPTWVQREFALNDYVTPTANVRVRFSVKDVPNNSIDEAAVDAFVLRGVQCVLPKGDMNCDGVIDFADINPFVMALTNAAQYDERYGGYCTRDQGDVNNDGNVDFGDINPFVALLIP